MNYTRVLVLAMTLGALAACQSKGSAGAGGTADTSPTLATVNGTESRKKFAITHHDNPLPTKSQKRRAMYCRSMMDVSAVHENRNGPTCSFRRYLLMIFTGRAACDRPRARKVGTSSKPQGCTVVHAM